MKSVCVCVSGHSGGQCGPPGCVSGALSETLWTEGCGSVGQTLQGTERQTSHGGVGHHGDTLLQSTVSV